MYEQIKHETVLALPRGGSIQLKVILVFGLMLALLAWPPAPPSAARAPSVDPDYGNLPLSFVPNLGQAGAGVRFQGHDLGTKMAFTGEEVILALPSRAGSSDRIARLRFVGVSSESAVVGIDRLPGTVNYFIGDDPAGWRTNIPTYAGIVYRQLYPGIDLRYDGTSGRLKGTYVVAPGASPHLIRWEHEGATDVQIDQATGDLLITFPSSTLIERAPVAWQDVNGRRVDVTVRYVLTKDGSVGFELGGYDPARPLIIDPTISYSTYLGGSGFEDAEGVAVDGSGDAYVVGTTTSMDFPDDPSLDYGGGEDVFVVKISASGDALLYSTYLGGGDDDAGNGVAVDQDGNAYITGDTDSVDFPTKNALQGTCNLYMGVCIGDAFVAKLDATGSDLAYSTYLGGSNMEEGEGIALNGSGNAYVIGTTFSADLPIENAMQTSLKGFSDAFVARLDAGGSALGYSTYLGGSATDFGAGIAVDDSGQAFLTGETSSTDFPTLDPLQGASGGAVDVFAVKLEAAGSSMVYGTYLGGAGADYAYGIAISGTGHAHIAGHTESSNFPTTPGAFDTSCDAGSSCNGDAFVAKVSSSGDSLLYGTFLGGSDVDKGYAIAVDAEGFAYVTGHTNSWDFPTGNPAQGYGGGSDAFAVRLPIDGSALDYSTYIGGSLGDYGTGIAVRGSSAVIAGVTFSSDFPIVAGLQATHGGGQADAFVMKLEGEAGPPLPDAPNLEGSEKIASRYWVAAGETLTYTIELRNSGTADASVDVTDVVPDPLSYVAGSADASGGVYDSGTRTVSWSDVEVPSGGSVPLEFEVMAPSAVDGPTLAVNTATISAGDQSFERQALVLLLAEPVEDDAQPPVVEGLTIDEKDVLTDPDVTLHISASDDAGVTEMYVQEWAWSGQPTEPWMIVQSSDWVPYQETYDWTLESSSGVHFVAVWVADEAGNVSHLTRTGLDYASLLLAPETLPQGGLIPYLVHYEAGQDVAAALQTVSGDADLYVWFPGNLGLPDVYSINPDTELDEVAFATPQSGTYLFLVHAHKASTYELSISPGGGPRAWLKGGTRASLASLGRDATANAKIPAFDVEPILTVDPLADAEQPDKPAAYLHQSQKVASQYTVAAGETLTYTILLWNTGTTGLTVDVTDPVPSELTYVPGSATAGAVYDEATRTLSWSDVAVDPGQVRLLSFSVTATEVSEPTMVTNRATIAAEGGSIERPATVLLVPESSVLDLYLSHKAVSQYVAMAGDVLTYTINIRNIGEAASTADVTDTVPAEMSYVSGSANEGGTYDADRGEVSWRGVEVGPGEDVALSFAVVASAVDRPTPVINTATIAAEGGAFERRSGVLLLPESAPSINLQGSSKMASQHWVTSGDALTYTIRLHNSGTVDVAADVTDRLPVEMAYVTGTATAGGTYDPGTETLSWTGITVPAGESVSLSFVVTAMPVEDRTSVVNTATITAEGHAFDRRATVWIVPEPVEEDVRRPTVESLTIDEQDVLADANVTLDISGYDDEAIVDMWLKEWVLVTTPAPHWEMVQSTDWIPYQETYDFTLAARSGVHFVGTWLRDGAGNVSVLTRDAVDYASLLLAGEAISQGDLVPYLVHYDGGEDVTATLVTASGDADLYVWFPGSVGPPDAYSTEPDTGVDRVTFTTPEVGTYLFLVHGYQASTYDLSISPAGGPRAWGTVDQPIAPIATDSLDLSSAVTEVAGKQPQFYIEQILALSGLDPLAQAEEPGSPFKVYLPLLAR